MNIDTVSDQLRGLSEKQLGDILKYIAYLKYLDSAGAGKDGSGLSPAGKIDRSAIFNCMPDIVIGDDFDAPVEEFEEYM